MGKVLYLQAVAAGDRADVEPDKREDGADREEVGWFQRDVECDVAGIEGDDGGEDGEEGEHEDGDVEPGVFGGAVA